MGKIEYPIQVDKLTFEKTSVVEDGWMHKAGTFVGVRPVDKEYGGKTYLGIYIGEIALSTVARYDSKQKELIVGPALHNPAIFVFDLGKIIFGCESWWYKIESEEQLKDITNEDIDNVWYVKALKHIEQIQNEHKDNDDEDKD